MKPFTILDVTQGTPEWLRARAGRATASKAGVVLAKGRGSAESVQRADYRIQLVLERIQGEPINDERVTDDMRRGTLLEPEARFAYESHTGNLVQQTGFLLSTAIPDVGCSLDGHIGDFGGVVEFKVPQMKTHLRYIREGVLPADYVAQVTHQALVTGAAFVDFVSFDPRFPPELQLFIVRVPREKLDIDGYEKELRRFLSEVDAEVAAVEAMRAKREKVA